MPDPHTLVHTQNFSLEGVNAHYTMADVWVDDGCFFVVISAPVPTADTGNDDEDEDGDGKPTHSSSSNSSSTAATVVRSDCRRPGIRDVQPDNQMLAFIARPRPKTTTPIVSMTSHMSLTMTEIPWQTACRSAAGSRWYDDDDDDPVENESSDIGTGTNAGDDAYERRNRKVHEALRQGFLTIAQAEPNRCVVLDAEPEQPHIAEEVWRCVQERLLQE